MKCILKVLEYENSDARLGKQDITCAGYGFEAPGVGNERGRRHVPLRDLSGRAGSVETVSENRGTWSGHPDMRRRDKAFLGYAEGIGH